MRILVVLAISIISISLAGCSTNPATGATQFTALMSPEQENQVGAAEHQKIIAQFGLYENKALQDYVNEIGRRVVQDTERPDVAYKFFVLDSPIVNAFALPGGYIYISRGLLALANNEAEMASVLGHEAGHITGRHSAERYSRGVVTSLGTSILSAVVDSSGISQALGLGSDLYMKSYSRAQENEADTLGIRYMTRAGYDPRATTAFLQSLKDQTELEARIRGKKTGGGGYFATHPATSDRVSKTRGEAASLAQGRLNRDEYLSQIDGMTYGDSAAHGFVRDSAADSTDFFHPELGFTFNAPEGYRIVNGPGNVVVAGPGGQAVIFDLAKREEEADSLAYLTQVWMKNEKNLKSQERITVNGMPAASAAFSGRINGQPATIRLLVIEWQKERFARFQIAIPTGTDMTAIDNLKRITHSFRDMSAVEKATIKPYRLDIVKAGQGDTIASLSAKMAYNDYKEERFAVLNGLAPGMVLEAGAPYKVIVK